MIISKSLKYFQDKARIDKQNNQKTAYKIQLYANKVTDKYIEDYKSGLAHKPVQALLSNEFAILNNATVYENYLRILDSPFIDESEKNFINKSILKTKADKNLAYVVKEEVKRMNKNLDVIEKVMQKYNFYLDDYKEMVKLQEKESMVNSNRFQALRQAVENFDGENPTFKIPEGYHYHEIKYTAENLLRESQMKSQYEEVKFINKQRELKGEPPLWVEKYWIHTHKGKTTRHASNHMKHVPIDQPFLIVNDKTLDIDEMMYPCDPNARPSNAYICYCEVEFRGPNGEIYNDVFDTLPQEIKPVDKIPQNVKEQLIDIDNLYYDEPTGLYGVSKEGEDFLLDVELNPDTYEWEYKGLPADKDINGYLWYPKSRLEDYNNVILQKYGLLLPKVKFLKTVPSLHSGINRNVINFNDMYLDASGKYGISEAEGLVFNSKTGKYSYKGLETDVYVNGHGWFEEEDILNHNKQFGVSGFTNSSKQVEYEYTGELYHDSSKLRYAKDKRFGNQKYIVDEQGTPYAIDNRKVYESRQDRFQEKIDYSQQELNSGEHWGRFGHQAINGTIFGTKKEDYDYSVFQETYKKCEPILNRLRDLDILESGINPNMNYINTTRDMLKEELDDVLFDIADGYRGNLNGRSIRNAIREIVDMDSAIEKSPRLLQNTCFIRYGRFDADLCEIGKHFKIKGFTSMGYASSGLGHFANKPGRWKMTILAKGGSKGIRLNDQFNALTTETELLNPRDTEFEVVDFNIDKKTVVLRVVGNP